MQLIKKKTPVFDNAKHPTSFAFSCGGIDYFQFDDPMNVPYKRGFGALAFYRNMTMRCSEEYLNKHTAAMDKIISNPNAINIAEVVRLNDQMKERLALVFEPETAYDFASVVYFDKTEDPTKYDYDYGRKKIEHWKKHSNVHDFFLQAPVKRHLPFLKDFNGDLNSYSKTVQEINKYHLERLHRILSTMKSKTESAKNYTSSAGSRPTSKATG